MSFSFLIHPLTARYMDRVTFLSRPFPSSWIEWAIKFKKPYLIKRFNLKGLKGVFVGVPLTSGQLLNLEREFVLKRLIQACEKSKKYGAKIVSFGAFTAIACNQGKNLVGKVDIAITTGRALTIGAVGEKVKKYISKDKVLGVIGANGAIGKACVKYFSEYSPVRITRNNFGEIGECDLLISTTNTTKEIIDEDKLKSNSIIFDVSKPSTISKKISRKDVSVLKAGSIKLPEHIDFGFDFDLEKDVVYACMAEPMILALENRFEDYSIGDNISLDKVEEILKLGKKWGFEVV